MIIIEKKGLFARNNSTDSIKFEQHKNNEKNLHPSDGSLGLSELRSSIY